MESTVPTSWRKRQVSSRILRYYNSISRYPPSRYSGITCLEMDHTANGAWEGVRGGGADRSTPRTVQLSVPRAAAGRPTEPAPLLGCVWLTPHPAARCDARPSSRQFNASKCAGGGEKCAEACRALTNTSYYMGHRPGSPRALGLERGGPPCEFTRPGGGPPCEYTRESCF